MGNDQLELFAVDTFTPPDELTLQLEEDIFFCKPLRVHPTLSEGGDKNGAFGSPVPHMGGRGNKNAEVMFIAYAPDEADFANGQGFSGALGAKLMQAVETYANLDYNEAYCTYLYKFANPPKEVKRQHSEKLKEYLGLEISKVKPKYIVCLGSEIYKTLTGRESELDQYCGNPVYYPEYGAKVALIWSPLSILSMPEEEHNWAIDLKMAIDRHLPNYKSKWQEMDALPTWRPRNMGELHSVVDIWRASGVKDFAIDTEFEPRTEWQDHILFKITISSCIGNIDLHLLRPRFGYNPVKFSYHNIFFVNRGIFDEKYAEAVPEGMIKPGKLAYERTYDDVVEYMRVTRKDFVGYIGEYVWALEDGDSAQVAQELTRLTEADGVRVWAQNGRTDYKLLLQMGWNLTKYIYLDIITLAHTLDEHQRYALEALSKKYLGAPSHKFPLIEWLHEHRVIGGKLPYSFVPREIIDPYATTDARRTYDLKDTLLAEMNRQDAESKRKGEPTLWDGYFNSRMPEFFNLLAMEILGEPINPYKLIENMKWYGTIRKRILNEVITEVKELTGWNDFNPMSAKDLSRLLFDTLGLTPLYTTSKPQLTWSEVMQLPEAERAEFSPATDGETLQTLAWEAPICHKLYVATKIGTIEQNYLRQGIYWSKSHSDAEDTHIPDLVLSYDNPQGSSAKSKIRSGIKRYMAEKLTKQEWARERLRDHDGKSLSLNIHKNGYIYTTYSDLLETMRLSTRPNMSALPKEESKDIQKLTGEKPPYEMRMLIEPGYTAEDFLKVRKTAKYSGIQSIVYNENKANRDWYVIESDWNTGEVWYLVAITGDKTGVETLSDPTRDVHATMARSMFPKLKEGGYTDMEIKEKFKDLRAAAKPFVFGIPYGRGAASLIARLNADIKQEYMERLARDPTTPQPRYYTINEGENFIESYARTFVEGWHYLEEQKRRVIEPGYLVSPWGFKRRFPRIPVTSKYLKAYQREASNWQIQHGIGCCRMEASKAYLRIKRENPKMPYYMISILHDATKFLVHASAIDEAVEATHYIMGDGMELPFTPAAPLRHSMEISDAWMCPEISVEKIKSGGYSNDTMIDRVIPTYKYADIVYQSPMILKRS